MKKPLKIWFNDKGDLEEQIRPWMFSSNSSRNLKYEDAKDFKDELIYEKIVDYSRGSARVYFKSALSGRRYSMFASDFHSVIETNEFKNNKVSGNFRFVKRGSAQAVMLIIEKTL